MDVLTFTSVREASLAPKLATLIAVMFLAATPPAQEPQRTSAETKSEYLPLAMGRRWVLKNPAQATPVVFEVVAQETGGFRVRSTTPWGMSEWTLVEQDGKFVMVAYGTGGPMQPLPKKPLYLDFTRAAGSKWSGSLGNLALVSRTASVQSRTRTFSDCIQIRQESGGNLLFTFAKGVGYVQFGEGKAAFILDESASILSDSPPGASNGVEQQPTSPSDLRSTEGQNLAKRDPVPIGITPNKMANEPMTADVMMGRFRQTLDAGAGFLVVNGKWAELEPREGRYSLESLNQALSVAAGAGVPISYTLRVIDTITRDVPSDLRSAAWSDGRLQTRLLRLIDTITPSLRGRARWFMLGYEIDGYFTKQPNEAHDFVDLHRLVKARVKQLAPEIEVSSTLTFDGIGRLQGPLQTLNSQLDFIALTYTPLDPGFTVKDPSVLPGDFTRMKTIAAGRKIVLQEIGYPTSPAARSSEDQQAEFYRLAFEELKRDAAPFAAVNFMTLADLSDADTDRFASFYGMKGNAAFKGVLQTLGMFSKDGKPKKSWTVLLSR